MESPAILAAIYCVPIVLACLVGGWLSRAFHLTHTRMQTAVSFVAGLILGVGLLHLIPHAFSKGGGSIDSTVGWAMVGFLTMFFVARFLHFHHHDAPEALRELTPIESEIHDHHHDHGACDQHPHHAAQQGVHVHAGTWVGTAFGMTLHSLIDGIALAATVSAEWHEHESDQAVRMLAGFGVFLAVLLHKPFDSLTINMLMTSAHCSPGRRRAINALYAAIVPVGVAILFLIGDVQGQVLGAILALAGGAFLCIASSDLLPELQFHTHDRFKLTGALLLGVALAWGITYFESEGHDKHNGHAAPAHHDHDDEPPPEGESHHTDAP